MRWLIRLADRTHPLALPGAWVAVSLVGYGIFLGAGEGGSCCWDNRTQMWGSALTFSLISAYLMAAFTYLYRSHRDTVRQLKSRIADVAAVDAALRDVPGRVALATAFAGALFGVLQFAEVLFSDTYVLHPVPDVPLIIGNVVLWTVAALLTIGRLHDARAMRRLGGHIGIDLYDLGSLRPIGRAAVRDVLVVMGALAFMPLQSLDAEFRWVNYQTGLIFGLISASLLFYLPVSGVHDGIRKAKAARLDELQSRIDAADRDDVETLEGLLAHRERIAHLSAWPVDVSIVSRVGFYLIIPPLAWVGAALVETLVQGYLD